jgi:uncharacterized FlaG/YvyC family protein
MSDKVSAVISPAPVAAPVRPVSLAQPGTSTPSVGASGSQAAAAVPEASKLQDVVKLQSLETRQAESTTVKPPPQSASQAESQVALAVAEATARAKAQAEVQAQQQDQSQTSVQHAAATLTSYFSNIHPDVNFRVEQQATGMVVLMVNNVDGKVLQTIPGDEAKQLAASLFGSASILPQTV